MTRPGPGEIVRVAVARFLCNRGDGRQYRTGSAVVAKAVIHGSERPTHDLAVYEAEGR